MQQQHYRWAIISDYHFTYICRTPKCKGTLKSNGHAKNRWSAPNPDGVSSQSLMVCVELQKSVCSHSSPLVWHTIIRFYRPLIYNFKHLTLYKMDKNCSRLGSFVSLSLFLHFFKMCPLTIQTVSLPLPSCWFWNASMTIPLTSSWHDVTDASILSPLDFSIHIGTKPEDFWVDYQILACPSDFITGVRDHRILESYIYIYPLPLHYCAKIKPRTLWCHWYCIYHATNIILLFLFTNVFTSFQNFNLYICWYNWKICDWMVCKKVKSSSLTL